MESFRRISPKDTKLSPKDKKISPKDSGISPKDSRISPKDKKISSIKKTWKMCWGGEVKGEGYILNLYIIFFLGLFRFLALGYFFDFALFFLYPRVHI